MRDGLGVGGGAQRSRYRRSRSCGPSGDLGFQVMRRRDRRCSQRAVNGWVWRFGGLRGGNRGLVGVLLGNR